MDENLQIIHVNTRDYHENLQIIHVITLDYHVSYRIATVTLFSSFKMWALSLYSLVLQQKQCFPIWANTSKLTCLFIYIPQNSK